MPKDTIISYEGETVSELKEDFKGAVDDYIAYCKEAGITPRKSYSGSLNIRISPEVHSKIAILAQQAGISINAFIKSAVESKLQLCYKQPWIKKNSLFVNATASNIRL